MKHIGNIKYAEGAKKKRKRIARGPGSGHGGTSTKGHKGAQSRTGYKRKLAFEGGQMPLSRRIPKFGFTNLFRKEYQIVNLSRLQELIDKEKINPDNVDMEALYKAGAVSKNNLPVKILGNGELKNPVNIKADKFSESAKQKIESLGGKAIINE